MRLLLTQMAHMFWVHKLLPLIFSLTVLRNSLLLNYQMIVLKLMYWLTRLVSLVRSLIKSRMTIQRPIQITKNLVIWQLRYRYPIVAMFWIRLANRIQRTLLMHCGRYGSIKHSQLSAMQLLPMSLLTIKLLTKALLWSIQGRSLLMVTLLKTRVIH